MNRMVPKISLIGSGQIGTAIAYGLANRGLGKVTMFDMVEGMPKGKALDISHAAAIQNSGVKLTGTNNYEDLQGSHGVIITAGIPRKPNMSRDDLLSINAGVVRGVGTALKKYCPEAFVVMVTNPLDAMVGLLQRETGLPSNLIVGMGGILDGGRFRTYLSEALDVAVDDIKTLVIGSHGDTMMPMLRYTTVGGIPVSEFVASGRITEEKLQSLVERARHTGAEIVGYLKTGSAFNAPAMAAIQMLESYLYDRKKLMCCSTLLKGQYGINDMYVGVPVVIGKNGIEDVIELQLNDTEKKDFTKSVDSIRNLTTALDNLSK